jgi:hypothetical protein
VRPKARVALAPFHLAVVEVEEPVRIRWRLTSTGVDGEQQGEITYDIERDPVEITVAQD